MNRFLVYAGTAVSIAVLVLAGSVLFGTFFDKPVLTSYVLSASMEPTLMTGDVIFINPFVSSPEINDIIVFKSGRNYVVHRISGVTQEGFITKGDNNIATDQLNGKPYVHKKDIIGKIVALGKYPVVIPHGGDLIKAISTAMGSNRVALIALLLIAGLYLNMDDSGRKVMKRGRVAMKINFSSIYFFFSMSVLVIVALSMVMVTDEIDIEYATTVAMGSNPGWVAPGEVFQKDLNIHNYGRYPYFYKLDIQSTRLSTADGTQFLLYPGDGRNITVTIRAPVETQLNVDTVMVWKYLPLLPAQYLELLFSMNPYLPILAVDIELAAVFVIVYFIIGGQNESPIRLRMKSLDRLIRELNTKLNLGE